MEGFGLAARLAPGLWLWVSSIGVLVFRGCGVFSRHGGSAQGSNWYSFHVSGPQRPPL